MKPLLKKQILFHLFLVAGILLQFPMAQAQFKYRDFTAYPTIPYFHLRNYVKIDTTTFAQIAYTYSASEYRLNIVDINGQVLSSTTLPNTDHNLATNAGGNFIELVRDSSGNFYSVFYALGTSWITNGPMSKLTYYKFDPNGILLNYDSIFVHGTTTINHTFLQDGRFILAMNHQVQEDPLNHNNLISDSIGIRIIDSNLNYQDIIFSGSFQGASLLSTCATMDSLGNFYLVVDSTITVIDTFNTNAELHRNVSWRLVKISPSGQLLWNKTLTNFNTLNNISSPNIYDIRIIGDKVFLTGIIIRNLDYTSITPVGIGSHYISCFDTSGTFFNEYIDTDTFNDPYEFPYDLEIEAPLKYLDTFSNGRFLFSADLNFSPSSTKKSKLICWDPVTGSLNWEFNQYLFFNYSQTDGWFYPTKKFFNTAGNLVTLSSQLANYTYYIVSAEIDPNGILVNLDTANVSWFVYPMSGDFFQTQNGELFTMSFIPSTPFSGNSYPMRIYWCDSCFSNVTGTAYLDIDNDCTLTASNDIPAKYALIEQDNAQHYTFTDAYGNYNFTLSPGNHDLEISLPQPNYFYWNCMSNPITVNAPIQPNISTCNDFSVSLLPNVHDIYSESFTISGNDNPGQILEFYAYVKNIGTVTETGKLELTFTDSVFTFSSANPAPDSISTGYLAWNYQNLAIFAMNHYHVELYIPTNISIGSPFLISTTAGDLSIDTFPNNNSSSFPDTIGGPFDPNDKQVYPQGVGSDGFITTQDSLLKYTVRFQNTGTDTAINVRIEDIIDTDLDLSTIQFDFYTHNFTPVIFGRKLVLKFDNIMLPDSGADYNNSMGMIQYSIKQNPSLSAGARIENYAAIYFDYNAPIFTNTTVNTITYPVNVIDSDPDKTSQIMVYPNPIEESVWLKWDFAPEDNFLSAEICSLTGQSLVNLNDLFTGKSSGISDITNRCTVLGSGIYLLQIKFENRTKTIKIVKF